MYFNNDKFSLYYEKYGDKKEVILILPGWGDTRKTFDYMINHLKNKYTVYIFDYPGFGNSPFPESDLTIYDYADMIRNFIKEMKIDNPSIIAHSFGGRITTILTGYYHEKINKLILIDIAGIRSKKTIVKVIKTYAYKILKKLSVILPKRKRNIYLKRLFKLFASTDYQNLDRNMYQSFKNIVNEDLKHSFKNINHETLIIWGENDKATPLRMGKYINKKINNSKLVIYPNSTHYSYLDYPLLTNNLIDNFL